MRRYVRYIVFGIVGGFFFQLDNLVFHLFQFSLAHELFFIPLYGAIFGVFVGITEERLERRFNRKIVSLETESRQLIDNLVAGICSVDRSYIITPVYNRNIKTLFGDREYSGQSIFDTIFYILESRVKDEIKELIDTAFTSVNASNDMLNAVNPVNPFTYVYNQNGTVVHKKIASRILRVLDENNQVSRVMFIFNDISLQEQLEKEQQKRDQELEDQYSKITTLLNNDKTIMFHYLQDLNTKVMEIKTLLRELAQNTEKKENLQRTIQIAHSLKGESFSLGFTKITELLKAFEANLKKAIEGEYNFEAQLELVVYFEQIENEQKSLQKLLERLRDFVADTSKSSNMKTLERELRQVCETAAQRESKKAVVTFTSNLTDISDGLYSNVKELLIHLIRNSISHGIEDPQSRRGFGKTPEGHISCRISSQNGQILLEYADDGRGLDLEQIREKVVERGLLSKEEAAKLKDTQLVPYIFKDGFSTASEENDIAGLGVGMSVVRDVVVKKLRGKIALSNRPGKGLAFRISDMKEPVRV